MIAKTTTEEGSLVSILPGDYLDGQMVNMIANMVGVGKELEEVEEGKTSRRGEGETNCGPQS